jgi:hypothetical protein
VVRPRRPALAALLAAVAPIRKHRALSSSRLVGLALRGPGSGPGRPGKGVAVARWRRS